CHSASLYPRLMPCAVPCMLCSLSPHDTDLPSAVLVFFFYLSGAHRDLHSFPTRRSSDLRPARAAMKGGDAEPRVPTTIAADGLRSEEHTSELQSRENLVCRLLLEKKKRNSD